MTTLYSRLLKMLLPALLLLGTCACTNVQSAPTMLDYSYVPPSIPTANTPNYGLEDY